MRYVAAIAILAVSLSLLVDSVGGTPGTTERVSVDSFGNQGNLQSGQAGIDITPDGRYVAFQSEATNLVPGDTNIRWDVFVHDRSTGSTERVSVASDGSQGNDHACCPSITPDGRYVAFSSDASNLVADDTNPSTDAFIRDRQAGTTEIVSDADVPCCPNSGASGVSDDGRYVSVESRAPFDEADTNGFWDVYVHDRATGTKEWISVTPNWPDGRGHAGVLSADGRYVLYESDQPHVSGDWYFDDDLFLRDRQEGTTEIVSLGSAGQQGEGDIGHYDMSPDARFVAWADDSPNLVGGDNDSTDDVFLRDRARQRIPLLHRRRGP